MTADYQRRLEKWHDNALRWVAECNAEQLEEKARLKRQMEEVNEKIHEKKQKVLAATRFQPPKLLQNDTTPI